MSAKNYVSERVAKRKEAAAEKKNLMAELDDIKHDLSREIDTQRNLKSRIKIFDPTAIDPEIRRLTRELESSSFSLQEEKKLVNQLKELEASKPYVSEYLTRDNLIDQLKTRKNDIWTRVSELKRLIEQYSDEINEVNSKVKDSRDKLNTEIPELETRIDALKEEIKTLRDNKYNVNKAFEDAKYHYEKQQRLIKHIEFVTKRKQEIVEREERKKAWEARQKEDEENKPEPWYFQVKQCDNYIGYLEKLIPTATSAEEQKASPQEANILPSKEERMKAESAQYLGASLAKGKGKKKERVRKAQKTTETALLNLPIDLLRFLTTTSIKAPYTIAEVPECLEAIKKQREWYKTNPEPEGETHKQQAPQTQQPVHEERKTASTAIKIEDFPKPMTSKVVESYGIFKPDLPQKPVVAKEERGSRRGRREGQEPRR